MPEIGRGRRLTMRASRREQDDAGVARQEPAAMLSVFIQTAFNAVAL
jgi:hypothetical protein